MSTTASNADQRIGKFLLLFASALAAFSLYLGFLGFTYLLTCIVSGCSAGYLTRSASYWAALVPLLALLILKTEFVYAAGGDWHVHSIEIGLGTMYFLGSAIWVIVCKY